MTSTRRASLLGLLMVAAAAAPAPAPAQTLLPFHVSIAGGRTIATGDLKDAYDRGWHGEAVLSLQVPVIPVGGRAGVIYHHLTGSSTPALTLLGGEVDATLDIGLPLVPITPYLVGGVGYYRISYDPSVGPASGPPVQGSASENRMGWNGGAGVRVGVGALSLFVEARYTSIATGGARIAIVPVTAGLRVF